jgi:hypothetical protein
MHRWRHWGVFKGPYAGHEPTGETIEMYGMAIATVTDDLKVRAAICIDLYGGGNRQESSDPGSRHVLN